MEALKLENLSCNDDNNKPSSTPVLDFIPVWVGHSANDANLSYVAYKAFHMLIFKLHRYWKIKYKRFEKFDDVAAHCGVGKKRIKQTLEEIERAGLIILTHRNGHDIKISMAFNRPTADIALREKIRFLRVPAFAYSKLKTQTPAAIKTYFQLLSLSLNQINSPFKACITSIGTRLKVAPETILRGCKSLEKSELLIFNKSRYGSRKSPVIKLLQPISIEPQSVRKKKGDPKMSLKNKDPKAPSPKIMDPSPKMSLFIRENKREYKNNQENDFLNLEFRKQIPEIRKVLLRAGRTSDSPEDWISYFTEYPLGITANGKPGGPIRSIPAVLNADLSSGPKIYATRFREWKYLKEKAERSRQVAAVDMNECLENIRIQLEQAEATGF